MLPDLLIYSGILSVLLWISSVCRLSCFQDGFSCLSNIIFSRVQLPNFFQSNETDYVQFFHFLRCVTDMSKSNIRTTFLMFDWKATGEIGFDEFYMLICILIANKDKMEQQLLYRHSRSIFDLIDIDGEHTISPAEFCAAGFLFNMKGREFLQMFQDYSGSRGENLTYSEFKLFIMACVDKQEERKKRKQPYMEILSQSKRDTFLPL